MCVMCYLTELTLPWNFVSWCISSRLGGWESSGLLIQRVGWAVPMLCPLGSLAQLGWRVPGGRTHPSGVQWWQVPGHLVSSHCALGLSQLLRVVVSEQWAMGANVEATQVTRQVQIQGLENGFQPWWDERQSRIAKRARTQIDFIESEWFLEWPRIPCNDEKSLFFIACCVTFLHHWNLFVELILRACMFPFDMCIREFGFRAFPCNAAVSMHHTLPKFWSPWGDLARSKHRDHLRLLLHTRKFPSESCPLHNMKCIRVYWGHPGFRKIIINLMAFNTRTSFLFLFLFLCSLMR